MLVRHYFMIENSARRRPQDAGRAYSQYYWRDDELAAIISWNEAFDEAEKALRYLIISQKRGLNERVELALHPYQEDTISNKSSIIQSHMLLSIKKVVQHWK